jgi:hypothetical protein
MRSKSVLLALLLAASAVPAYDPLDGLKWYEKTVRADAQTVFYGNWKALLEKPDPKLP